MIPLAVPDLAGREDEYLAECVATTFVSSVGAFVDRFEKLVAEATGCKTAVATASGTSALHLMLISVGVQPNDLVILPTYTFVASANSIRHAGADPVLLDVSRESWTLDPKELERFLVTRCESVDGMLVHVESGRRVGAVMPVYTLGHPAKMDEINELARAFGVPVVADAAAAIGATYENREIGELSESLALSFDGNKTITCGGGGAVATNDQDVADRVRHLSTTARSGPGYLHTEVGYNYRMTNLQAAIGCAQMERWPALVSAKRSIASHYSQAFEGIVPTFPHAPWAKSADWLSGVLLPTRESTVSLREQLRESGIDAREFWMPMHLQPPFRAAIAEPCPVAEDMWDRVIPLPCSAGLDANDRQYVVSTVERLLASD